MPSSNTLQNEPSTSSASKTLIEIYDERWKSLSKDRPIYGQNSFYFTYHICIDLLKERATPGEKVLDIGCCTGLFRKFLKEGEIELEYYGLDLSKEALYTHKRNHRDAMLFTGSATDLPFQDASFDYIVSAETVEHIPDTISTIKEMLRVLKPRGRIILSVPNYGNPLLAAIAKFYRIFLRNDNFAMGEQVFEHHFTTEYLDALFEKLPLRIVKSVGAHYIPNKDIFIWISEGIPLFKRVVKRDYFYSNTRFKSRGWLRKYGTNVFYLLEKS